MAREPLTWKPPMTTGMSAPRNARARSAARGNWLLCTPTRSTTPRPPRSRRIIFATGITVFDSSYTLTTTLTSSPSTRRAPAACAKAYTQASELDGMMPRSH